MTNNEAAIESRRRRFGISLILALLFFVNCSATAQQPLPDADRLATLDGTTVNSLTREPVRKARVVLELPGGSRKSGLVSTTDQTGHFRFAGVEAGRYNLTAEKEGFLDGSYGADRLGDDGSLLKVTAGDRIDNLSISLSPAGTISGHVQDADGDPIRGEVTLWTREKPHGKFTEVEGSPLVTNLNGDYRWEGLRPGTYYVSADRGSWQLATPRVPVDSSGKMTKSYEMTTFYPASLSLADSQTVTVESGQVQSGIDIRIQQASTMSVKGRVEGLKGSASNYSVSGTVDNRRGFSGTLSSNGDFAVTNLPPGKVRLTLNDRTAGYGVVGTAEANLTDHDMTGLTITPFEPAQVRVKVVMDGERDKPLTAGVVYLSSSLPADNLWGMEPQNGVFILRSVRPGKYGIWFNGCGDCYLKSVESDNQTLDPGSLDVRDGAVLDLLLTFSKNVASLTGDVEVSKDQASKDARVLLISETAPLPDESLKRRSPKLDQLLTFSQASLPPGKYLAFAAQEIDFDLWSDEKFVDSMRSDGVEVELHEKEQGAVHLKLIPKDKIEDARKRLGL